MPSPLSVWPLFPAPVPTVLGGSRGGVWGSSSGGEWDATAVPGWAHREVGGLVAGWVGLWGGVFVQGLRQEWVSLGGCVRLVLTG